MFNIKVYGEGRQEDLNTNSWREATHNFNQRVSEAVRDRNGNDGYNKTWIEVSDGNEPVRSFRIDLDNDSYMVTDLKKALNL